MGVFWCEDSKRQSFEETEPPATREPRGALSRPAPLELPMHSRRLWTTGPQAVWPL